MIGRFDALSAALGALIALLFATALDAADVGPSLPILAALCVAAILAGRGLARLARRSSP